MEQILVQLLSVTIAKRVENEVAFLVEGPKYKINTDIHGFLAWIRHISASLES